MGRPVNFDSPLPDGDLTQKLHNKLYDVHNNNNNVLENFRKMYRLYTRRTAQLAAGGPVSGELLYIYMNGPNNHCRLTFSKGGQIDAEFLPILTW